MIIDAMDILHNERVDGFCLVSSDSDFTRLATRLRESGMLVVGIGEKKTPQPFIAACDKFLYIEIINSKQERKHKELNQPISIELPEPEFEKVDDDLICLIKLTIDDLGDENGWAFLAEIGNLLIKKKPDFDPWNYGYSKLTPLLRSLDKDFEIDEREVENTHIKHIYVRTRDKAV